MCNMKFKDELIVVRKEGKLNVKTIGGKTAIEFDGYQYYKNKVTDVTRYNDYRFTCYNAELSKRLLDSVKPGDQIVVTGYDVQRKTEDGKRYFNYILTDFQLHEGKNAYGS